MEWNGSFFSLVLSKQEREGRESRSTISLVMMAGLLLCIAYLSRNATAFFSKGSLRVFSSGFSKGGQGILLMNTYIVVYHDYDVLLLFLGWIQSISLSI